MNGKLRGTGVVATYSHRLKSAGKDLSSLRRNLEFGMDYGTEGYEFDL